MKLVITYLFLLSTFISDAQLTLETKDITNLIAISELYSKNPNANGNNFIIALDSLRTPVLNNVADALIQVGKGDTTIFTSRFLSRPNTNDLILWYVLREIHYNMNSKNNTPRPNLEVANEILAKNIDERWLLDNYYYRITGGIGSLFNTADLSNINIDIEALGLKNETEKAIFYFNMMDALIGGRFRVLQMMNNKPKIIDFSNKLPLFNGKKYYYYKNFDFKDFDWKGSEKTESYCERHIGDLYNIIIAQFNATSDLKSKQDAQDIYFNSILSESQYFKFSSSKDI